MKEKRYMSKKVKKNIFTILVAILIIAGFIFYKIMFKAKSTYTVMNGYIEKVSDVTAIILKDETVIELKNDASAVPVIEQGKRVSRHDVIATYKSESYEKYLDEIEKIDKDIQTLVKDLPVTYSVDVENIEKEITKLTSKAKGATSYLKMQEYKSKIDELTYKKVIILGELSPAGSKIRELIDKRKEIEEKNKSSNDNIKAMKSGLVTYKLDTLENSYDISKINDFSVNEFNDLFFKYSENNLNNFGIKIIDNYLAYFAIKIPRNHHEDYIEEGYNYKIKTNEKESDEFLGKLIKKVQDEENNYLVFKITDGIENLVDDRIINLEVIWDRTEGMAVLNHAIKRSDNDTYDYVIAANGGEYLQIPVKIISSNDGISIVENYSNEEKEALGIDDNKNKISLYDVLVIE